MKNMIKADSEYQSYEITVNFAGYIGADETYSVVATSREEAEELALEQAAYDLSVEDLNQIDDNEWEASVGFCGYIGVEEEYTVIADDEDEAYDAVMEQARADLEIVDED